MSYLVLIETSSNQRYIFSTNKLRENVGASELTYQIGTKIVRDLIKDRTDVEGIITTSGKAILLADTEETAKEIVREVTKHALKKMPGLTVHGAICKVNDANDAESMHEAVGEAHKRLEEIRYQIPSNLQRFQRVPFVAECASSNLPASNLFKHEDLPKSEKEKPHSIASVTKQLKSNEGKKRLENSVKEYEPNLHFAQNINALDKKFGDTNWLAVIHADGNGLGQLFLEFCEKVGAKTGEEYRNKYRKFSKGLDECTTKAVAFALKEMRDKIGNTSIEVPAIPLVLGGDDLTIICDGQYAIKFTKDFLTKFVEQTKSNSKIREVFPDGIDLGICAGIAIIKPHFPFHQAYHLAEELLQSAKKTKSISTSLSAFDYHVLYDSSGTTLEEIRDKTPFVARPYVVTEKDVAKSYTDKTEEKTWIENHHFGELEKRVEAMIAKDEDDKNQLPNSQMHVLREGLFIDEAETEARANLIKHRYKDKGFNDLLCQDGKLFFTDEVDGKPNQATHFLDALDIVEFWK